MAFVTLPAVLFPELGVGESSGVERWGLFTFEIDCDLCFVKGQAKGVSVDLQFAGRNVSAFLLGILLRRCHGIEVMSALWGFIIGEATRDHRGDVGEEGRLSSRRCAP